MLQLILLIIPALAIVTCFYPTNPMQLVSFYLVNQLHTQFIIQLFKPVAEVQQYRDHFYLSLAIDGISQWLVWLVNFVMAIVILSQTESVLIYSVIGFWCIAVFCVLDLFQFYVCFEGVVIPMQFMIGWYGGGNRKIHGDYSLVVTKQFSTISILSFSMSC